MTMEERRRKLEVLQEYQLRDLVEHANNLGITKEDIVTVLPNETNGFYLLYFK